MDNSRRPFFDPNPPDLPELADLPADQRVRIWRQVQEQAGWGWSPFLFLLSVPVFVLVGTFLVRLLLGTTVLGLQLPPPLIRLLSFFVTAAVLWGPLVFLYHRRTQRQLWRLVPHLCAGCGYNLSGNTSDRCPECGLRH